jgi:hypothetical protein
MPDQIERALEAATDLPPWMPRGSVQHLLCGRFFDVVRVSSFNGIRAIGRLGNPACPLIEDSGTGAVYWLVPVGSADGWELPSVEVLGTGKKIAVPPLTGPESELGRVRWLVRPPMGGSFMADPGRLHEVLVGLSRGPRFTQPVRALRRHGCGALVVAGEEHDCEETGADDGPTR